MWTVLKAGLPFYESVFLIACGGPFSCSKLATPRFSPSLLTGAVNRQFAPELLALLQPVDFPRRCPVPQFVPCYAREKRMVKLPGLQRVVY